MMSNVFRGIRIDNGYFTEGCLFDASLLPQICTSTYDEKEGQFDFHYHRIHEETIGQQTPFIDITGKQAFEGDKYTTGLDEVYTIFKKNGAFCGGVDFDNCAPIGWDPNDCEKTIDFFSKSAKIIGTIHD